MSNLLPLLMFTSLSLFSGDKGFEAVGGIVYAEPAGERLKATLYLPAGGEASTAQPRPAVVLIHGGAWAAGSRRQMFWYGRRFAEHGYVALSISYRVMPSGVFPAPVEDAKAAVRWLRLHAEEYGIDPGRIAALGTSAGGHLALMLAVTEPGDGLEGDQNLGASSAVQAAVSLYGPTDLSVFEESKEDKPEPTRGFWKRHLAAFVGDEERKGRTPFEAASPISYVSRRTPPILCIHGDDDGIVPVDQSKRLCRRIEEAGVTHRFIEVPGYSHAFDHIHPKVRRELFEHILSFLNENLKPESE